MRRQDLRFLIEVGSFGVRTTPRISAIERQLALLAEGFPEADLSWVLEMDGNAKIMCVSGFQAERLQIGTTVAKTIGEFVAALEYDHGNLLDTVETFVANLVDKGYMFLPQIDWSRVPVKFVLPDPNPRRFPRLPDGVPPMLAEMLGDMLGGAPFMGKLTVNEDQQFSLELLGAKYGAYRDDVNALVLATFYAKMKEATTAQIPRILSDAAASVQVLRNFLARQGVEVRLIELFDAVAPLALEAKTNERRRTRDALEAALAPFLGHAFPELMPPAPEPEVIDSPCAQCHDLDCGIRDVPPVDAEVVLEAAVPEPGPDAQPAPVPEPEPTPKA